MNSQGSQVDGRATYETPKLTKISLRPEEAVLGHCKMSGGTGPTQTAGPCDILLAGCRSIGS